MKHCDQHEVDSVGTCPVCVEIKVLSERSSYEQGMDDLFLFCDMEQMGELKDEADRYDMGPCELVKWERLWTNTLEVMMHLRFKYSYPFRNNEMQKKWKMK